MLEAQTIAVSMDEPAVWYAELIQNGRRVQIIKVIRNDALAEFKADLGPSWAYKGDPEQIFAGQIYKNRSGDIVKIESWHTVGECVEMGERNRNNISVNQIYGMYEPKSEKDFMNGYHDAMEIRRRGHK